MDQQTARRYFKENRIVVEQIEKGIGSLTASELTAKLPNSWSIAVTLAHLAFWDERVIQLIETAVTRDQWEVQYINDQVNDVLAPILAAIPPLQARQLFLDTAKRLDDLLEQSPFDIVQRLYEINERFVARSLHRSDHFNEIKRLLRISTQQSAD